MKRGLPVRLWIAMVIIFLQIPACSNENHNDAVDQSRPEVKIGRLICGGHLSLAIVENMHQDELSTFRLKTIQNHDWQDVVNDMKSGKLAGTFILSPLAMNMIREGIPAKIIMMADRNGNGFVVGEPEGNKAISLGIGWMASISPKIW